MKQPKIKSIICLSCLFFLVWGSLSVWAQLVDLRYKERTNKKGDIYSEGIISKLISPPNIELISALVNYYIPITKMSEQLGLQFYLERPATIYLRVQELDYTYYYRMERTIPLSSSIPGGYNTFEWSTQKVLKHLKNLDIYDLGAVARLDKSEPRIFEEVAPVIFYHLQHPVITGKLYLFIFKTSGNAKLTCSVYKEEEQKLLFPKKILSDLSLKGRPFIVPWNSEKAKEGYYQLKIKGYFLDNNLPIERTVRFYHK